MGGSLALALRSHCKFIFGVDSHAETLSFAIKQQIIDQGEYQLSRRLNELDLIILAVPVKKILEIIPKLPEFITNEIVIIDIGSTKRQIIEAYHRLPSNFQAVGGHPMCGKAVGGIKNAEASLFQNAPFALVRTSNTTLREVQLVENLVQYIGAVPLWLSATAHDEITANTSHLPYLMSCALVQSTPDNYVLLAGPGFRSASRLATTPVSMMGDILETNQDEILKNLDHYLSVLYSYRKLLAQGEFQQLKQLLSKTREKTNRTHLEPKKAPSNED
jgi:prephenate dehydrogenase